MPSPPPTGPSTGARSELVGFDPARDFLVDARSLRGVAHPLRTRMLGILRAEGPSTATRLAQRLGESSGATSYHLRQLAAYGFVVEDERDGRGRERWWRAAHRSTWLQLRRVRGESEDTDALVEDFLHAIAAVHAGTIQDWAERSHTLEAEWEDAGTLSDLQLRLSLEETAALRREIAEVVTRYRRADAGTDGVPRGARVVDLQWQLMPRTPK